MVEASAELTAAPLGAEGAEGPSVIGDHRGLRPGPHGAGGCPPAVPQARRDLTSLRPGSLFSSAETRQGTCTRTGGPDPASLTITTRPTRLAQVHELSSHSHIW